MERNRYYDYKSHTLKTETIVAALHKVAAEFSQKPLADIQSELEEIACAVAIYRDTLCVNDCERTFISKYLGIYE